MSYVTRGYAADECVFDSKTQMPTTTVITNEDVVDTGLLDAHGMKLFRVTERIAVGFGFGNLRNERTSR